jgi:TP901 family phage tail tape measure protein
VSITAERLMVEVQADVRQALAKLDQVERKAESSAARMGKMAKSMGIAFGGAAIAGGIQKTVSLAMNFDATMRQVGVQTEQTGKGLTRLGDLAIQMGKDTVFSAQDASGAMLELAKGGLTAAQIQAGALDSTLKLAAAGGLDLANAAGYITQGMSTFGMGAKDADQIVTALAGGANASTASVESLGMALSQVGPGARNAGFSIQDTVAALAAFDNAGIKGSDAGTSLKTMLTNLVPATKKAREEMQRLGLDFVKGNGDFENLADISDQLRKKLGPLSEAQRTQALRTIFGSDATRAATVLMNNGRKGIEKYQRAVKDTDKAQEMANSTMEGAKGAWENLTGTVETAAISVGKKLLPAFTAGADKAADFVDSMMGWGPEIQATFGWVPDLFRSTASALTPVVDLVKAAASAWTSLPGPVKELAVQGGLAMLIFPRLSAAATGAATRVAASFTTMSAKARQYAAEMTYAETRTAALGRVARAAAGPAGMLAMAAGAQSSNEKVKALTTTLGAAAIGFSMGGPLGAAIGGLAGGLVSLNGYYKRTETAADKAYARIQEAGGPVKSAKASLDSLKDTLDQVTGAYTGATRAAVLKSLADQGLIEKAAGFGITSREMVNAAMGQEGAWRRVASVTGDYKIRLGAVTDSLKAAQAELKANMEAGKGADGALVERINNLNRERATLREQIATLRQMPGTLRAQAKEVRAAAQASADYTGKLKGIPKKARTAIQAEGIPPTVKGVADLAKRYNLLDKKKVRTLVEATGADLSVKKIMRLIEKAKELGNQKPKAKTDVDTTMSDKKLEALYEKLRETTRQQAKPSANLQDNATPSLRSLNAYISSTDGRTITITTRHVTVGSPGGGGGGGGTGGNGRMAAGKGSGGGYGAYDHLLPTSQRGPLEEAKKTVDDWIRKLTPKGQKLAEALVSGFTGTSSQIVRQVEQYAERVNAAYDRRIEQVQKGKKDKGDGKRVKALEAERDKILRAAEKYRTSVERFRDATASLSDGFGDTVEDARRSMADIRKTIQQTFSGKAEARWLKVVDAANTQLEALYARRADLAVRLEEANRKVADLEAAKESFRSSVFSGMDSQATVLNAGNNAGAIAQNLQTQVAKVKEFASLLSQLRSMGYSDAVVMQVASAGIEGGMASAKALAAGTNAEVSSINSSMAQITAQATATSDALAGGMYDAGIAGAKAVASGLQAQHDIVVGQINQMAYGLQEAMRKELRSGLKDAGRSAGQGLIDGLTSKKGPLGEAAADMAKEMVRAIKAELKIKSPSRILRAVGRFVPQGMALGIRDDTRKVSAASGRMARAAVPSWDYRVSDTDSLSGGQRAGSAMAFTFVTHNPTAEPVSRTQNAALAKVASLGLV